jgi:hypothetical protein
MKREVDMRLRKMLAGLASATGVALILLVMPMVTFAQETTSSIRGTVTQPDGQPAAGATVKVTDTRTGTTRTTVTSGSGNFSQSGLRVGGPYTVQIEASGFAPQEVTDISLGLGETYTFEVALTSETLETVMVTGSAIRGEQVAVGPSATFSIDDLEDAPAINRNINDVLSIDPRIYVDEAFNDAVQCAGANPRFNALTVDGVRLSDNFGLNSNGYPTERMPFPYDAIEQISVELAPFDVMYGGFSACNINAVTKSGGNRFGGGFFYDYTNESLSGDELEGDPIELGSFNEKRYGFAVGGPILPDRLFFFASYEKLDGINIFDRGPADVSAGDNVLGVTQAQLDRIAQIARDVYGYDPGGTPVPLDMDDEKYLVKLDWNITDSHRAAYTYNFNDGFNNTESDPDNTQFEFSNHLYERGAELKSHVAQIFSSWTDNFTTEFRYSYADLDNRQIPLGGTDFGEVQVRTFNDPDGPGGVGVQQATIYLGADDSRHANDLYYDTTTYKLAGNYTLGDHVFSLGLEREELDVFNMFIQEAEGEFRFDSAAFCTATNPATWSGCIDAFQRGEPSTVIYENAAPSNIPTDAGAMFGYEINTAYLQDEFPLGPVTLVAGLRYDWYTTDDLPRFNQNFVNRNGFTNQNTFDGEGLLQPRLGVTWDVLPTLSLRGGVGLYSGGNPNVWLANNYQANGITQVEFTENTLDDGAPGAGGTLFNIPTAGQGRPIFDIPQNLVTSVTNSNGNGGVNALAPGFKIPKEWKLALGATWDFDAGFMGEGYRLMFDYLHTRKEDSAFIFDSTLRQIGTAPDGRPLYRSVDASVAACNQTPIPAAPACPTRTQDFILANVPGDDGESDVYSLGLSKNYDWGLDWTLGYAYTDATEVSPMTSSVAFSNYTFISVSDINNPDLSRSNYNIKNRFTLNLNYRRAFWGDNETTITLYGRANEGRPFSPVFFGSGAPFGDPQNGRQLLYVPTGPTDPNVNFLPTFDQAAFFAYLEANDLMKYAGGIAERNSLSSDWWHKFDLRISQDFPAFGEGHKFSVFLLIENLGNLIDSDMGVFRQQDFPHNVQLVGLSAGTGGAPPAISGGRYNYATFFSPAPQRRFSDASLWEVRFGVNYKF